MENTSWAAYHESRQSPESHVFCPSALLPLFLESAQSGAMIKHCKSAVEHLNPGQTPLITFDQPLFAIARQIQWKWSDKYGEDKFVVMCGGLQIEMAALKTLGDWLKGSGWVQAEISTPCAADSFLQGAHIAHTRRVDQITVAALHTLKHRAYDRCCLTCLGNELEILGFEQWCIQRAQSCMQFQYWATVMQLEICVLVYVRSLRQSSFKVYIDALTQLAPCFHFLDHTNYARWIPIHLRDMAWLNCQQNTLM